MPGYQHVLGLELTMPLLHGPDADDDLPSYPEHPGQLSDRTHPTLGGGDVVYHSYRHDGVETLVTVRQRHVITDKNLELEFNR